MKCVIHCRNIFRKPSLLGSLNFKRRFTSPTCHMSHITCHLSPVTYPLSHVIYIFFYKLVKLIVRACYRYTLIYDSRCKPTFISCGGHCLWLFEIKIAVCGNRINFKLNLKIDLRKKRKKR